ncbi:MULTISPECIES: aspartyl-phosphate phosphatase Spo0E family protein [Exiguobacterium]|uniref:aspartyl-phosphate phosphatase Spo0E family protein n=1 Tax=Exiguobacterium TaxID=33986 RepID=UPI0004947F50|nr:MULTISPECIES: aspartyl-phosphate phosphatase Spo0E family protein [Exiguobacterium]ASI35054.1 Spo0E family sporulation regulatory protein-aspartic acid phosphatase [Exiguobacterium sp. N4-1P]
MTSQQLLTLAIEAKRSELYLQADRSSFTSPHVLKLSHELDLLLVEYTRIMQTYAVGSSNERLLT